MNKLTKFFSEAAVSLKYRNMKLYCSAAMVSLIGSMMQETMIAWLAFDMTGSTAVLGNVAGIAFHDEPGGNLLSVGIRLVSAA